MAEVDSKKGASTLNELSLGTDAQNAYSNQICTASRILEKRRQLAEVDEALEAQKDEFARKIDAFRRREEALRKKDLRLQDSLIKFNKFLQENENKRTRAIKRCADESRIREEKEKEVVKLTDILKRKTQEEKDGTEQLLKNKKFQQYLNAVVHEMQLSFSDYSEIQDALDRFETLKSTNDDLLSQLKKNTKQHEESRLYFTQFSKTSGNAILNMNNQIASLQKEMDLVTSKLNNIEGLGGGGTASLSSHGTSELTADLSQIFVVVDQILERFESVRAKHKSTLQREKRQSHTEVDLENKTRRAVDKLEKICDYLVDYKSIVDEWEEQKEQ